MTATEGHLALLRSMVKADVTAVRDALSDPKSDLIGFLRFAHHHQLGAYAYWTFQQLGVTGELPARTVSATRASSLVERRRTERQVRQLRDLADLLDGRGAEALFMKGPLFTQRFYGSLDARGFSDLDVLIRSPDDLDRIEAMLLDAGYEPAFRVLMSRRASRYFTHHFGYRRNGLPLDLHWALQRHFTFAIDYQYVWATSSAVTLEGRTYRATSDEYELVLQILGVLTDLQVGQLALRALVDIHRMLKTVESTLDWGAFFARRQRERILRPCLYVLAVVLDVLDCRDQFATLGPFLEPRLGSLPSVKLARRAVLESRKVDLGQKLLAFRLYESSLVAAASWWLVSLPFRFAVYASSPAPAPTRSGPADRSPGDG